MTLAKFLRAPFLTENLRWLLLYMTILVNLLLILKICLFVEIKFWNTPLRITLKNRSFQDKYLWRSSILVKALCLRFTVILPMILKLMVLRNFVIILSALTGILFFSCDYILNFSFSLLYWIITILLFYSITGYIILLYYSCQDYTDFRESKD